MKLKIGLAQNILYQFNIFCTGTKTNCTKVQIELQHVYRLCIEAMSVKGSEASHIYYVVCLFQFHYFRRSCQRGIKSLRLEVTFIKILH